MVATMGYRTTDKSLAATAPTKPGPNDERLAQLRKRMEETYVSADEVLMRIDALATRVMGVHPPLESSGSDSPTPANPSQLDVLDSIAESLVGKVVAMSYHLGRLERL